MAISKLSLGVVSLVAAFGATGVAHADFVKTVSSESQCIAQDGSIMDLNGAKHCLVAVIPDEFQAVEYAGELKGVTECPEKSIRKTSIGDFCLLALEPIKTKASVEPAAMEAIEVSDTVTEAKPKKKRSFFGGNKD